MDATRRPRLGGTAKVVIYQGFSPDSAAGCDTWPGCPGELRNNERT
jgi:hypothetical protein